MFKRILPLVFVLVMVTTTAWANVRVLAYRSYKDGQHINNFHIDLHPLQENQRKIFITIQEGGEIVQDELYIDSSGNTIRWKTTGLNGSGQHTRYTAQRMGNSITLEGKWKGSPINKEFKIDGKPLFFNPKMSLMSFVNSSATEIEFWGLRQDKLTIHKMIAKKEGEEVIGVNDEPVKATRVHWTVKGLGSMFFKRIYWFRVSDGLYIKQLTSDGGIRELVGESEHDYLK